MKSIGCVRAQDLEMLEGLVTTVLTLVETVRNLQGQLDVVDQELQWAGTDDGRLESIRKLKLAAEDDFQF